MTLPSHSALLGTMTIMTLPTELRYPHDRFLARALVCSAVLLIRPPGLFVCFSYNLLLQCFVCLCYCSFNTSLLSLSIIITIIMLCCFMICYTIMYVQFSLLCIVNLIIIKVIMSCCFTLYRLTSQLLRRKAEGGGGGAPASGPPYIYTYMHVYIYIYKCMYVCMYIYICIYTHIYVYVYRIHIHTLIH